MKKRQIYSDLLLLFIYTSYSTGTVFIAWRLIRRWVIGAALVQSQVPPLWAIASVAVVSVILLDGWFELWCDQRPIPGIKRIRGWPIVGNLWQIGSSAAITFWRSGEDLVQIRAGTKRLVIVNSFEAIQKLWVTNAKINISRPQFWTFHEVVSKSQGTTIGTTAYSEDWKRMKKAVAEAVSDKAVRRYADTLLRQVQRTIEEMGKVVGQDVNVKPFLDTFALLIVS